MHRSFPGCSTQPSHALPPCTLALPEAHPRPSLHPCLFLSNLYHFPPPLQQHPHPVRPFPNTTLPLQGAHILSGNVFDPKALDELLPEWKEDPTAPITTPVARDAFYYLTSSRSLRVPMPPLMHNKGNYVISLR